jgi:hypothetical protein
MAKRPPKLVALNYDEHSARSVGKTADGRQFFLTRPFKPAPGHEFLALYLFSPSGGLVEARGSRTYGRERRWIGSGRRRCGPNGSPR